MRLFLCALLALAIPAFAQRSQTKDYRMGTDAPVTPGRTVDFNEDFEAFTIGGLDGQMGWTDFWDICDVFAPGITNQSARHNSDGSGWWGTDMEGPVLTPDFGCISFDIQINGTTTEYDMVSVSDVVDGGGNLYNMWLIFDVSGEIQVIDAFPGGNPTFVQIGNWSSGQVMNIGMCAYDDGMVEFFIDGTSAFIGPGYPFQNTSTAGGIQQVLFASANTETGDNMVIDNIVSSAAITAVPTMSQWAFMLFCALFAIVGLTVLRRKN